MQTAYDELPYPGGPFVQTHPDHLATIATLFGIAPPPIERCRVLELGCGDGGNLIPMAFALPGSSFTGIDLAGSAIARGQELIGAARLGNIRLRQLDVLDVNSQFGEFDYIVAHGLYSWVPPHVREQILNISRAHLAPNGLAFISYNTYPGGHLRDSLREMMRFHTRNTASARDRVTQAHELLQFLLEAHPEPDAYSAFLRQELQGFLTRMPEHFYHDELGEHNHRFYFHEFVKDVSRHRLQFLSESRLASMQTGSYAAPVIEKLRQFSQNEQLAQEQYLDFLNLRNFRQSLLCRCEVNIDRTPRPQRVMHLLAASEIQPSSPSPDVRSIAAEQFNYPNGGNMSTNNPLAKAAMLHLGRIWPQAVPVSELLHIARSETGRDSPTSSATIDEDSNWLSDMVLKLYTANFVELHTRAVPFVSEPSERPQASQLALAQLRNGSGVTNLRHSVIEVQDETARQLLSLLDGTRDRAELLRELRERLPLADVTREQLDLNLNRLAKLALLVA
jgi:methyltransferase-like protein/2-polyprenyl-3-methyl-5-hydroxy-6-metoxy-1,4-benzoquinol methylase